MADHALTTTGPLVSEAHLPSVARSAGIVRWFRGRRRSWKGWAVFVGFIVLNEARGTYMVAQILAQTLRAYRGH